MISTFLILSTGLLLIYMFYKWAIKNNQHFINQTITVMKPTFLLGNSGDMLLRKKSAGDYVLGIYNKFPKDKIVAFFDMRQPSFFIRDPELLKQLTVKHFEYFIDRNIFIDNTLDPLIGRSLVCLRGHVWKNMRGTLSPAFTGSKMRLMFDLVSNCGEDSSKFLHMELKEDESKQIVEVKELFARFSNDVIATCAFGIEINSLKNKENEFYKVGERMTSFASIKSILKIIFMNLCPWIMKQLGISFSEKTDIKFFNSIIIDTMNARKDNNIIRPDMIEMLMKAKMGQLKHSDQIETDSFATVKEHDIGKSTETILEDIDIVAQCFLFFFAGFDTISTAMSFIAFELAVNPDIQEKLLAEVDSTRNILQGGKLTYDALQKMKYLDMVTSETLRKWPPAPFTDRVCSKDLNFTHEEINVQFKKGDRLMLPIMGLHRDQQYYSNPDKFDPERFNEENKHKINPLTYLPFGTGPRNCIGSRFALMEAKSIIYYILLHFTFEVCKKTELPLEMGTKKFRMVPDDGIWLQLKPRAI